MSPAAEYAVGIALYLFALWTLIQVGMLVRATKAQRVRSILACLVLCAGWYWIGRSTAHAIALRAADQQAQEAR